MQKQVWSESDIRIAFELRAEGRNSIEIGARLGRKPGAVRNKFLDLEHPERRIQKAEKAIAKRRLQREVRQQTPKASPFELAMLTAIKSGQEKALIGVVKDNRPLNPVSFSRGMIGSGCGSSALACAEATDGMPF